MITVITTVARRNRSELACRLNRYNRGMTQTTPANQYKQLAFWGMLFAFCCLPIFAVMLPLTKSSVYWTFQSEWASEIWSWLLVLIQFVQLVFVLLFAFGRPAKVSVYIRCRNLVGLLLVLFGLLVICAILQDFWQVRPDSWDSFIWRLKDNWNEGRFLGHVRNSIMLLAVTLVLWFWSYLGRWHLVNSPAESVYQRRPISIVQLMLLTAVLAILFRLLVRLGWRWNYEDVVSIRRVIPIALTVMSTAMWKNRATGGRWILASIMAIMAWGVAELSLAWYGSIAFSAPWQPPGNLRAAGYSYGFWLSLSMVGWWLLRISGFSLIHPNGEDSLPAREPPQES